MHVADLIASRREVFSVQENSTVHDAARYLRERQVRSVGVFDSQGRLVGVLSQSDISDKVAAENKCPAWMHVSEVMTAKPITVLPETPLDECLRLMETHNIFHLPILDSLGHYHGMVSVKDLLSVIASDQKARADLLESFLFAQR